MAFHDLEPNAWHLTTTVAHVMTSVHTCCREAHTHRRIISPTESKRAMHTHATPNNGAPHSRRRPAQYCSASPHACSSRAPSCAPPSSVSIARFRPSACVFVRQTVSPRRALPPVPRTTPGNPLSSSAAADAIHSPSLATWSSKLAAVGLLATVSGSHTTARWRRARVTATLSRRSSSRKPTRRSRF